MILFMLLPDSLKGQVQKNITTSLQNSSWINFFALVLMLDFQRWRYFRRPWTLVEKKKSMWCKVVWDIKLALFALIVGPSPSVVIIDLCTTGIVVFYRWVIPVARKLWRTTIMSTNTGNYCLLVCHWMSNRSLQTSPTRIIYLLLFTNTYPQFDPETYAPRNPAVVAIRALSKRLFHS